MTTTIEATIRACALSELQSRGCVVVRGADRPVVLFYNDGDVRAVDNRCPHLVFPLHRGSIKDGMITCHWHHAHFDARSGCTFDLWADDVPPYDVEVRDGHVYVSSHPRRNDPVPHAQRRLRDGMEHNIGLISAKAILGLRSAKVEAADVVRTAALYGCEHRDGWAMGLTILTAMANLLPHLSEQTAFLALYQGVRRTAADCAGQASRRARPALDTDDLDLDTLERWLRYWTLVRHRDGAERTLLAAIHNSDTRVHVPGMLFTAATDRFYADGGHLLDFCNKAYELLELIGHEHAQSVLPALTNQLVSARGGEESNAWRHPTDLVPLIQSAAERLPRLFENASGAGWDGVIELAEAILGDDPAATLSAIEAAIGSGAKPAQLSKALAYAAAQRVARFGTANEISDWVAALHSFSYCNALHQALKRWPDPRLVRGVLYGAISVYLNRFLNVPPAKLPGERGTLDDMPTDADELLDLFLAALDSQQQVDRAAGLIARYLSLDHPPQPLIDTLTRAAVREDADFHTLQMLEAGVAQYHEWGPGEQGTVMLLAVARYLAAHSPTQRAQLQTATIALRLHRGENIYEDDA